MIYSFKKNKSKESPFTIPFLVGVGAMLPDLDGISVFFNHKVYYSSFWYSHHGALHSLFGIIPLSVIVSLIIACLGRRYEENRLIHSPIPVFGLLYLGNIIHILEDLPCPPGPWQGLMVFWPLSVERYGGWSNIWWLNEYIMMVTLIGTLCSITILVVRNKWMPYRPKMFRTTLFLINSLPLFILIRFVINSRYVDADQWTNYQRALLGDVLYPFLRSWNEVIQHIWVREIL